MKLLELHINGFGKFHDRTISFQDGVNLIYGNNEAGKSTIHTFIRSILFGLERGRGRAARNDLYSRYEPWEGDGAYEGFLRLESGGTVYRIERRFRKEQKALTIVNETKGVTEEPTRALWERILGNLNETTYNNTISIGQLKSATEEGMVGELKNYIANLNTTGNISLNISKATAFLKAKKRSLEAGLIPDASREYTALLSEIRALDTEISSPEYENLLASYQKEKSDVREELEKTQKEKDALGEKIQRGKVLLAESRFTDKESVTRCEEECQALYGSYLAADAECQKKSRKISAVLNFLIAAAGIITVCRLLTIDPQRFLTACAVCGAASLVCIALGIHFLISDHRYNVALVESSNRLSDIFGNHLGDSSVSESAMTAFGKRMDEFKRLCEVVEKSEATVQTLNDEIRTLQEKQESCGAEIEKQQKSQWELEKKLEQLSACRNHAAALKRVLAENDRIREELSAIDLAQETMSGLSLSIRDSFGLYLNKEASRYIAGLTGGIYDSMSIDENLNVFLNTRTKLVPIENVSSGTMDQVYLALRLAAAKLLQAEGEPFPLLLDDSFTQYDEERLRSSLLWLTQSYPGQLIIFTCHKRESQILTDARADFKMIEI